MTDEQLKEYGIRSIQMISEDNGFNPRLLIAHLDGESFSYPLIDSNYTNVKNDINIKINQHINKYYTRRIRKDKLNRINGN